MQADNHKRFTCHHTLNGCFTTCINSAELYEWPTKSEKIEFINFKMQTISDMSKYCARNVCSLESADFDDSTFPDKHLSRASINRCFMKLYKGVNQASSKPLQKLTYLNVVLLRHSPLQPILFLALSAALPG